MNLSQQQGPVRLPGCVLHRKQGWGHTAQAQPFQHLPFKFPLVDTVLLCFWLS